MTKISAKTWSKWIKRSKPAVFILCLVPILLLAYDVFTGQISADPVEDFTKVTGEWGLRILLITLAITPLRSITGINQLILLRRMLGVYSFFYIFLHFLTWLVIDHFFDFQRSVAFLLMIPLAATSFNRMVRWMGGKRWLRLHKLVYAIGCLAILHYYLLVKADITEPVIYGLVLALLLGYRVVNKRKKRVRT